MSDIFRKDLFYFTDKVNRIYLKRYPTTDEDSDYLSAVYVDGVKLQNQYLATQLPMPSTINDFWRMIAEFKVELILMLQPPDFQDPVGASLNYLSISIFPHIKSKHIYKRKREKTHLQNINLFTYKYFVYFLISEYVII